MGVFFFFLFRSFVRSTPRPFGRVDLTKTGAPIINLTLSPTYTRALLVKEVCHIVSVWQFVCLSVYLSVRLYVCLSVRLSELAVTLHLDIGLSPDSYYLLLIPDTKQTVSWLYRPI